MLSNIAIIPARSGSKGLVNKNIKLFNGKPLIAYSIEVPIRSGLFKEIVVSTDSEDYARIALDYGASVPFLRSPDLSTDSASTWDVARDVISYFLKRGTSFDTLAILQPTSPLRTVDDIIKAYGQLREKNANAITSVCEVDHSPLWSNTLPKDNSMQGFLNQNLVSIPRQNLPTYYRINGALYILKTEHLMSGGNIFGTNCYAYIMNKESSVDIDDCFDFRLAEMIMADRLSNGKH